MIAKKHGHLVCISSSAGLVGVNGLAGKRKVIDFIQLNMIALNDQL